ncbi:unnamed protein product, partial [Acidithrix sp. C25]
VTQRDLFLIVLFVDGRSVIRSQLALLFGGFGKFDITLTFEVKFRFAN